MNQLQIIENSTEEKIKKNLEQSISKKRKQLAILTKKLDLLNSELETVRQEYEQRIGKLYAKDNALDIEIIKYKNIARLIEEGVSLNEARKELDDFWFNNIEKDFSYNDPTFNENIDLSQNIPQDTTPVELKKLWKKLILEFHPDLVTNPKEKEKRENIMKKINKAYKENNLDALRLLESKLFIEEADPTNINQLEYVLVEIENLIIGLTKQYKSLKLSEWFVWQKRIKKAEKEKKDIFIELEKSLIEDIVGKTKILKNLKQQIGIFE
ncbi:MAG TPA: DnaJ domain-containing protein [Patescibacteria group bacterium]